MVFDLKSYYGSVLVESLSKSFGYRNKMEVPRLVKVVINRGVGAATSNAKLVEVTMDQMWALTGQKPLLTRAKKSISNFKLREGQIIGCKVTLRRDRMWHFVSKLFNVGLPKIRDFRGVPTNSFDGRGNYTLGIKVDDIFSETETESGQLMGFDISFVTTAKTDDEAYKLLAGLGMPFRKTVERKS